MPSVTERKPTPEQLLQQVESEETFQARGRLKIFLGYASGVGKSFRMIDEGRRRKERGQDVVVGATQGALAPDARAALCNLDIIPLRTEDGVQGMDVNAILKRNPKVCLVDGLAYDNPSGSPRAKRWQDVETLLNAGISVITSVNLQHIEEKRPQVEAITSKHVEQTVPLSFLNMADEIVIVDAPPASCMKVGDGKSQPLTQTQLSELREIALLLAADVVDKQLERYLARHGIEQLWGTQERLMVWLTPNDDADRMLSSAARNRDRFHGELIVVTMKGLDRSAEQKRRTEQQLELARTKQAEIVSLEGDDVVESVLRFARQRGITQIYVGHKGRDSFWERAFGTALDKLIAGAEGIDVRVFPHQ